LIDEAHQELTESLNGASISRWSDSRAVDWLE
jgi:hypothetical protein